MRAGGRRIYNLRGRKLLAKTCARAWKHFERPRSVWKLFGHDARLRARSVGSLELLERSFGTVGKRRALACATLLAGGAVELGRSS